MGYFIVLEGLDGSGKTSVSRTLINLLNMQGVKALYTYEPFGRDFIKLMNTYGRRLGGVMEAFLMAADRFNHVTTVIEPALKEGMVVVSDRYYYSSIAYQGAKDVDVSWVKTLNSFAPEPDVAIYLDVEPELGLARKKTSSTKIRYMEEDVDFLRRVRLIYRGLVTRGSLIEVDASRPLEEVVSECSRVICKRLNILCQP
ncbi:MAG: dTMP kinase [Zestosphaera sp.]